MVLTIFQSAPFHQRYFTHTITNSISAIRMRAKIHRLIRQPSIANSEEQLRNAKTGLSKNIRICTTNYTPKVLQPYSHTGPRYSSLAAIAELRRAVADIHTEAIEASMSTLSVDARKRAEKDSAKKEAKAAAAEKREKEAKEEAMVYIKRVERNKRKYVTAVSGLEAHGLDLKKVAKDFGKKCTFTFTSVILG